MSDIEFLKDLVKLSILSVIILTGVYFTGKNLINFHYNRNR